MNIYKAIMLFDFNSYPFFVQNIIILIPMGYMLYAANFGLFDFDQIEFLALHWSHNTDPYCLLYSSINTWRLAIPIAYNFL